MLNSMNATFSCMLLEWDQTEKITSEVSLRIDAIENFLIKMFKRITTTSDTDLDDITIRLILALKSFREEGSQEKLLASVVHLQLNAKSLALSEHAFKLIENITKQNLNSGIILNWASELPKQLWNLKGRQLPFSQRILSYLKRIIIQMSSLENVSWNY
jgi:hypothetical protein